MLHKMHKMIFPRSEAQPVYQRPAPTSNYIANDIKKENSQKEMKRTVFSAVGREDAVAVVVAPAAKTFPPFPSIVSLLRPLLPGGPFPPRVFYPPRPTKLRSSLETVPFPPPRPSLLYLTPQTSPKGKEPLPPLLPPCFRSFNFPLFHFGLAVPKAAGFFLGRVEK